MTPTRADAPPTPVAALRPEDEELLAALRATARERLVEQRAATLPRTAWGELARLPRSQRAQLRAALALTDDPVAGGRLFLDTLSTVRGRKWRGPAERELRELLEGDRVWTLLDLPPDPAGHGVALRRVLAHLAAGGRAAEDEEVVDDGA